MFGGVDSFSAHIYKGEVTKAMLVHIATTSGRIMISSGDIMHRQHLNMKCTVGVSMCIELIIHTS